MCEKLRGSLVWRHAKNAAQIQKKPADRLCNISFGGDGRCVDESGVRRPCMRPRMRQRLGWTAKQIAGNGQPPRIRAGSGLSAPVNSQLN